MIEERSHLPVSQSHDYILNEINNNSVLIIRGETGCGKTTQVEITMPHTFVLLILY